MIILLIIGIALTGLAIGSLARVTLWPRGGHVRSAGVPRRVEEYGFSHREHAEESPGGLRDKLDDVATKVGSVVGGRSGHSDRAIKKDLISAGLYHVTPGRFLGYRVLCALGFPILWIWLGVSAGVKPVGLVLLTFVIGFLGWWMPARILRERANQRMNEIDYQLPELIDLLVVTIGQIMRDLAQEMRRRRRAVAQEKAQKAPIKILFPLVLLIFPAMFVILLGPAIFTFVQAIGGIAGK